MSRKADVFAAIRDVCGIETCPLVSAAAKGLVPLERVTEASVTAHQLRHALAALLRLHIDNPRTCPNCERSVDDHNERCHVGRLLELLD